MKIDVQEYAATQSYKRVCFSVIEMVTNIGYRIWSRKNIMYFTELVAKKGLGSVVLQGPFETTYIYLPMAPTLSAPLAPEENSTTRFLLFWNYKLQNKKYIIKIIYKQTTSLLIL